MKIVPITKDNWEEAIELKILPEQYKYLRENVSMHSLAKCYIYPDKYSPWMIIHEDKPLGCFRLRDYRRGVNIVSFFIDKKYQGKGLGRMAMQTIIDWVREDFVNAIEIELWVIPENKPARKLYESLGFYYTGEENEHGCLYMELQLNGT